MILFSSFRCFSNFDKQLYSDTIKWNESGKYFLHEVSGDSYCMWYVRGLTIYLQQVALISNLSPQYQWEDVNFRS